MTKYELLVAVICVVSGAVIQYRAKKAGAADMQILGFMLWAAGLILLADCQWHFLTEPEH